MRKLRVTLIIAAVATVITAACREAGPSGRMAALPANGSVAESAACSGDSLRPATAAPAEGLWIGVEPMTGVRVAALIGSPRANTSDLELMRRVETIEIQASGDTVRYQADAISVRLELLPLTPERGAGRADTADVSQLPQPTAALAVTALVRVAAYEPCAASIAGPRLRYLRRDAAGRIIVDAMLRRASANS
jgi:hypothetical protein